MFCALADEGRAREEGEKQDGWIMSLRNETEFLLSRIITHRFRENSVLAQQSLEAGDAVLLAKGSVQT